VKTINSIESMVAAQEFVIINKEYTNKLNEDTNIIITTENN